jgi:RNA polymerase-binding transcription factor DksA
MSSSARDPVREDALVRRAEDLEALRQAEHDSAPSGDLREETGESSIVSQHPADTADFTYQRQLQQTTQQLLEREAAQVDAALRARAAGTYGVCQNCRRPIPAERLAARPEATLCVACQQRTEAGLYT